jgi:hypothetical protein
MVESVLTKVCQQLLTFLNRPFKSYDFSNRRALGVKQVSLICKMLPQTTAPYSCSHKILQRQTLSWDCPFNTRKPKQFNLVSKALENMIRVYYTLKLVRFAAFIGQWGTGQRTAYPRAIFASVCQIRMTKSADLQRMQAGCTLVWSG